MSVNVGCASCGVDFCISDDLYARRRRDHGTFYCPNGHRNFYAQKTHEELRIDELTAQVDRLQTDRRRAQARYLALDKAARNCPVPRCYWRSGVVHVENLWRSMIGHFMRAHRDVQPEALIAELEAQASR